MTKLKFTQEHVSCSVALHSDLDGSIETNLISNADPQTLIESYLEYLEGLAQENEVNELRNLKLDVSFSKNWLTVVRQRIQRLYRGARELNAVSIPALGIYQSLVSTVRFTIWIWFVNTSSVPDYATQLCPKSAISRKRKSWFYWLRRHFDSMTLSISWLQELHYIIHSFITSESVRCNSTQIIVYIWDLNWIL